MSSPVITALAAAELSRERIRIAERHRLIALARCCRPSTWARVVQDLRTLFAGGHKPRAATVVCCAA